MKRIIILLFLSLLTQVNFAQFPNFSIGGLSRAISNTSYLDSNDSINEDINQKFNIIFDMAIDGKLNKHVNFYSELRLGSSLDVFDTSASYIDLRRILVFGEFNKNLSFEVGDVVEFDTGKRAGVIQGKILRKNIKNIIVRTQLSDWNVTASLLTKVAA